MDEGKFSAWALVEIMGHDRLAGVVSDFQLGGISFVRVDVPPVAGRQGFTKLLGAQSIFSISLVDKEIAISLAEKIKAVPVQPYEMKSVITDVVKNRLKQANIETEVVPYMESEGEEHIPF